jgi:hypothetical protein
MGNRGGGRALALRAAVVPLLALLVPASATADRHKAGFGGGGTRSSGSSLWGITISGDVVLREGKSTGDEGAKHHQWMLGLAGEISQVSGEHEGGTLSRTTFLVGPRFTLNELGSHWRVQPFVQVLGGRGYERLVEGRGSWAFAFGGGLDVPMGSLRSMERHPLVVVRAQFARHWLEDGAREWYNQGTVSVIFRLNRKPAPPAPPPPPPPNP